MVYSFVDLTTDEISNLQLCEYLDQTLLTSLISNNSEFKLLTIGTKSDIYNKDIFNESFILCYKSTDGRLLYKQLKIDTELYNEYKYYQTFTKTKLSGISDQILKTDKYKENNEINYSERIYSNYNDNLSLELVFNKFKESKLVDILIYNEDLSLDPDEIICSYEPSGETLYDCRRMCLDNMSTNLCKKTECNDLCKNCKNLDCKWNITNYNRDLTLKPSNTNIKAFSGNGAIKITWLSPDSKFPVDTYYIIVKNVKEDYVNIYVYKSQSSLNEYIISNIKNNNAYSVNIVSKNKFGTSQISNTETVIPSENKSLNVDLSKQSFDNSVESYYKDKNPSNDSASILNKTERTVSLFEKTIVVNNLKDIINDKFLNSSETSIYNINVY